MSKSSFQFAGYLLAATLALGLMGCQGNHKRHVSKADARWKAMRSGLMFQMAQQQFDAGDLDQSEKTLNEALQIDPRNAKLYALGGRLAMERGHLERAYHRFKGAIEINPQFAPAHYYQGIVMQRWTQFDAALVYYHRAYEIEPDNAAYLLAMVEMLVAQDRLDEAMEILTEKMTYFDLNAGIRTAIGQLYFMRGDYDKAVEYYRQASLIRPEDAHIHEELALSLLAAGHPQEAARRLEQLCEDPKLSGRRDLKMALADSYFAARRITEAKTVYIQLTRSNPLDAGSWIKLGELAMSQRDGTGAMIAAGKAIKLAPHKHEGYVLAGVVLSKQRHFEEALEMFDQAAHLAPEDASPLLLRGITLERQGLLAEAAEAYGEALRRQPDDTRAQQLLAKVSAQVEQNVLTGE
jgi:tetratricopeptide (TPR) repeat protein